MRTAKLKLCTKVKIVQGQRISQLKKTQDSYTAFARRIEILCAPSTFEFHCLGSIGTGDLPSLRKELLKSPWRRPNWKQLVADFYAQPSDSTRIGPRGIHHQG